jgi:hypothetical protein
MQRETSTLQRQLHSSREQEAGLRRTVAGLQGEVAKLKALNDQTAAETAELLAALSSLRQSQSQLAGDLHIKEEMLELVQQQLRWGAWCSELELVHDAWCMMHDAAACTCQCCAVAQACDQAA